MATKLGTAAIDGWGNRFDLWAEETSTNKANNQSTVKTWLNLYVVNGGHVDSYDVKVKVSGANEQNLGYQYYGPGTHTLKEASQTVTHNTDGSKTIGLSGYFHGGLGSWDLSGNLTLTKFNRVATINSFTGTDVKSNFSATYTKEVSSLRHKLRIQISGGYVLDTYDNYVSGTNVTLSANSINYLKSGGSRGVYLQGVIETWDGSTKIGESASTSILITIKKPAKIRIGGTWRDTTPYVRVNGQWKEAIPYMRVNGTWKEEN